MSHIVVLSSIYLGKASTNGLCARNIVRALKEEGHDVNVICYDDLESARGKDVFTIPDKTSVHRSFASKFVSKLKKACLLLVTSPKGFLDDAKATMYYESLCSIDSAQKVDVVVAMLFPLETAEAIARFKRFQPNTKAIIYELDSISDGVAQSAAIQKLLDHNYNTWLKHLYTIVDNVIIMKSHTEYWLSTFGSKLSNKLKISDIPVLLPRAKKSLDYSNITFIYAGLIEKKYRSPEYLLHVINEISKRLRFTFLFFSKGDCEDMISEMARVYPGVKQHGYVEQEKLDEAINDSTFLVSIGNSISKSVPSKLISYISYQKPIIHFSSQKDDICKEYLKDYPLSLVVDQNNSVEVSANQILSFIDSLKSGRLSDISVNHLYEMNLPSFSAKLISSIENSGIND